MSRKIKNIICIMLVLLMGVMVYLTMNYAKNNISNNQVNNNMMGDMSEPPEKTNDMNDNMSNNENNRMEEPPEKVDANGDMTEPPERLNDISNNVNSITGIYYLVFGIEFLIIFIIVIYLIMSNMNKKNIKETFNNKDKIIIYILSIIICISVFTYFSGVITNKYFISNNNSMNNSNNNSNITYSGVNEIKEDTTLSDVSYESSNKDENALLVSGSVNVSLSNVSVNKTGDSDGGDNTSFYGTNSGIIAKDSAVLNIDNSTIVTNATGANGVFSYGGSATTNNSANDGTTINISNSKITTSKDNSGGIMATCGGIINASNLEINTSGTSSAAIRSDRGGGTITVDDGSYTTNGIGSPSIYSTANITVSNAKLISNLSEGIVIEGKNSVTINNCTLEDSNTKLNGKSTTYKNIFLYQSMSGDASLGSAEFTSKNSNITTNNGDTFYVTNTTGIINLENNNIVNNDTNGKFLRVKSDSWGNTNSNGGDVTMNATNQKMIGNIVIDNISTLKLNMNDNSYYEGIINGENTAKSIELVLDNTSSIKLTGDSYATSLVNSISDNSNINFNGYKLYVNGIAIN